MSDTVAYAPKAAYADPDCLGAVFVNDTTDVNVRELVTASADGTFVVSDPDTIAALDRYEPVKRVAVPDQATAPEAEPAAPAAPLGELTKRELLELPEASTIDGAAQMKVDELRDAVKAAREGQ
jgi:hypothetical protein